MSKARRLWAEQTLLLNWARQTNDKKKAADYRMQIRQIGRSLMNITA